MLVHFMTIRTLQLPNKQIKAEPMMEATFRSGMGFKRPAVIYKDQEGKISVRLDDEFERLFPKRAVE